MFPRKQRELRSFFRWVMCIVDLFISLLILWGHLTRCYKRIPERIEEPYTGATRVSPDADSGSN